MSRTQAHVLCTLRTTPENLPRRYIVYRRSGDPKILDTQPLYMLSCNRLKTPDSRILASQVVLPEILVTSAFLRHLTAFSNYFLSSSLSLGLLALLLTRCLHRRHLSNFLNNCKCWVFRHYLTNSLGLLGLLCFGLSRGGKSIFS